MKRIILIILTLCMAFNLVPAPLVSAEENKVLYIGTVTAPEEATQYARDQFAHFHADTLEFIGFTADEAANMRLAPAFKAEPIDSSIENAENVYYYPVINKDSIIAVLIVSYDGVWNHQFGSDIEMARTLNTISTTYDNPAKIVISKNGFYAVVGEKVSVLEVFCGSEDTDVANDITFLAESTCISVLDNPDNIIAISNKDLYPETAKPVVNERFIRSVLVPVAIVDNKYYGQDVGGVCWASCTGALIDYYKNGYASSSTNAERIKYEVLAEKGSISGGTYDVINYLNAKASIQMKRIYARITWEDAAKHLFGYYSPAYSIWEYRSGEKGHGMVFCGMEYETSDYLNEYYYNACFMDPNNSTYLIKNYNDSYYLGGLYYKWVDTVVRSDI